MAIGILSVGLLFIGGVFPAAIQFSTIATERTIASAAADEALAKVRIFGRNDANTPISDANYLLIPNDQMVDFNEPSIFGFAEDMSAYEYRYPSTVDLNNLEDTQYSWQALCRRTGDATSRTIEVTVFVTRKMNPGLEYYEPIYDINGPSDNYGKIDWSDTVDRVKRPVPAKIEVELLSGVRNELMVDDSKEARFFQEGAKLVDNETGEIYRILEKYGADENLIVLDRDFGKSASDNYYVWLVPPAVNGGRNPCIGIVQKEMQF